MDADERKNGVRADYAGNPPGQLRQRHKSPFPRPSEIIRADVDRDVEGLNEAANGGTIFKCQQFDVTARLRLKVLGQIDGLMFRTANVRQRANDNQTFRYSISTYWDIRSPAVIPDYSQYPLRIGGRLLNWPLSTAFCDCPASSKEVHPVGEGKRPFFEASFNRSVKVQGGHDRLTSDGGAILLREADHRLGLIDSLAQQLSDPRNQNLIRYRISELLRERIYGLALGYRAQDDLDRLAHDPAMRMATWDRPGQQVLTERLASQPTQSRLLDVVAHVGNNLEVVRRALADCPAALADAQRSRGAAGHDRHRQLSLGSLRRSSGCLLPRPLSCHDVSSLGGQLRGGGRLRQSVAMRTAGQRVHPRHLAAWQRA